METAPTKTTKPEQTTHARSNDSLSMDTENAARSRLIVALDFSDPNEAESLVEQFADQVIWYKVGLQLYAHPQVHRFLGWLRQHNKRVFLDLKLHDIPTTVNQAVSQLHELADMTTVHAQDQEVLEAAVAACGHIKILGVTVLTSISQQALSAQGWPSSIQELVCRRALLAKRCGCAGVVCSALEVGMLRTSLGATMHLVTPGIRLQPLGDDQKRTSTPAEALASGANQIVVGRPVTQAADPVKACKHVLEQLCR